MFNFGKMWVILACLGFKDTWLKSKTSNRFWICCGAGNVFAILNNCFMPWPKSVSTLEWHVVFQSLKSPWGISNHSFKLAVRIFNLICTWLRSWNVALHLYATPHAWSNHSPIHSQCWRNRLWTSHSTYFTKQWFTFSAIVTSKPWHSSGFLQFSWWV